MTVLTPTPISTRRFTYVADEGIFVGEASNLPAPGRVYDDACDIGYTLVSARTGRQKVFSQERSVRDGEGDLLYDEYVPLNANGRPDGSGITLRVYND